MNGSRIQLVDLCLRATLNFFFKRDYNFASSIFKFFCCMAKAKKIVFVTSLTGSLTTRFQVFSLPLTVVGMSTSNLQALHSEMPFLLSRIRRRFQGSQNC